jgi:hypothetical protein
MDIRRSDAAESGEQRQHQRGGDEEYCAIRKKVGDEAHETGRHNSSSRGEALIASESIAKRGVADQAKANGSNRQPQEAAGDPLEHQSGQHQRERRPNCNDQRAGCNHRSSQCDREPLRLDSVEQCAAGELTQQSGEPGCRQHKADVLLGPILLG